jgi:hypothetical protein
MGYATPFMLRSVTGPGVGLSLDAYRTSLANINADNDVGPSHPGRSCSASQVSRLPPRRECVVENCSMVGIMYGLQSQPDRCSGDAGKAGKVDASKRFSLLVPWPCVAILGLADAKSVTARSVLSQPRAGHWQSLGTVIQRKSILTQG